MIEIQVIEIVLFGLLIFILGCCVGFIYGFEE